jgi:hypothetical protein
LQVNIAVDTVNGVRGAFAAKDIQEGDLLLVIPENLTWTLELGGADNPAVSDSSSSSSSSDSSTSARSGGSSSSCGHKRRKVGGRAQLSPVSSMAKPFSSLIQVCNSDASSRPVAPKA